MQCYYVLKLQSNMYHCSKSGVIYHKCRTCKCIKTQYSPDTYLTVFARRPKLEEKKKKQSFHEDIIGDLTLVCWIL